MCVYLCVSVHVYVAYVRAWHANEIDNNRLGKVATSHTYTHTRATHTQRYTVRVYVRCLCVVHAFGACECACVCGVCVCGACAWWMCVSMCPVQCVVRARVCACAFVRV